MTEKTIRKITVEAREMQTKDGSKKFFAYRSVMKDGRYMDTRFVKEISNVPKNDFVMHVLDENINITKNRKYPILWVKSVEQFESMESHYRSLDEAKSKEFDDIFG